MFGMEEEEGENGGKREGAITHSEGRRKDGTGMSRE
jgi:hypothetical protein